MKILPQVTACCDPRLHVSTVQQLWHGFSMHASCLTLEKGQENTFSLGGQAAPLLPSGKEFVLEVTEEGAGVTGRDESCLMRGIIALLMKMQVEDDGSACILPCREESAYLLSTRMVHICVFPELTYEEVRKTLRLAAALQYTHAVLEFWGMLRFDCLPELSWPCAFTKAQARALIDECRHMGMEPVPMFNSLGHASQSRVTSGKHVVLEQNPALQSLFTPDGWSWNILNPQAEQLLKRVRQELYALFGPGEYIHLGCDEADSICLSPRYSAALPDYLKRLTHAVAGEGRRPMLWMDMLLKGERYRQYPARFYTGNGMDLPEEALFQALHPHTVQVDWQYGVDEAPVYTTLDLLKRGGQVMGAPWFGKRNVQAHVDTALANGLDGIMLTTWHVLHARMEEVTTAACVLGASLFPWQQESTPRLVTASLIRRLHFEGTDYANAGWVPTQLETHMDA